MKDFEKLYKQYYAPLYSFILRLTSYNSLLTEEITQETFYQAYISIHRYNGKCNFFTWLCQISKNCYFKYLKKHKDVVTDFVALANILLYDEKNSPEKVYELNSMKSLIHKAIHKLNKKQKNIIILRVYFELSFKEIGQLVGMSENAAKVNFYRAKEKLKEELGS